VAFVSRYGFLGPPETTCVSFEDENGNSYKTEGEQLERWQDEIQAMRELLKLWAAYRVGNRQEILRFVARAEAILASAEIGGRDFLYQHFLDGDPIPSMPGLWKMARDFAKNRAD
jgi:hypothetical protein